MSISVPLPTPDGPAITSGAGRASAAAASAAKRSRHAAITSVSLAERSQGTVVGRSSRSKVFANERGIAGVGEAR
jgi:hypothetical protein